MKEHKTLDIEIVIDTELHNWKAPEHIHLKLSEEKLIELIREDGWELPIYSISIKKISVEVLFVEDDE